MLTRALVFADVYVSRYFVRRAYAPLLVTAAGAWPADVIRVVSDLPTVQHGCNITAKAWQVRGGVDSPFKALHRTGMFRAFGVLL